MKNIIILLTFTALCATLICPSHSFAQTFIDGQMPDTFLAGHAWSVNSVAFSPDGQTLASGSGDFFVRGDNTLILWDVATGSLKATLEGHERWVSSVAFSPDGQTLASGSADDTIKLWDVATETPKTTLKRTEPYLKKSSELLGNFTDSSLERGRFVSSVAFSPDGKTLASGVTEYLGSWSRISSIGEITQIIEHVDLAAQIEMNTDDQDFWLLVLLQD